MTDGPVLPFLLLYFGGDNLQFVLPDTVLERFIAVLAPSKPERLSSTLAGLALDPDGRWPESPRSSEAQRTLNALMKAANAGLSEPERVFPLLGPLASPRQAMLEPLPPVPGRRGLLLSWR